jgi:type I restriction enzyme S subunit
MANNWSKGVLGDIAEIIMGQSPKGTDCNESENGIPLLNGPTEFTSRHPSPTQFTTDPKKYAEEGDLLFCVRGSTTGRMNWADQRYAIGRGIGAFRHNLGVEYQAYLRALIEYKLPSLLRSATGSTFPNVSKNQLLDLEIDIASDSDALKISKLIDNFDQRIFLNRQINQTLEQMAEALFNSWFVDFDPVIDKALNNGTQINDFPVPLQAKAKLRETVRKNEDYQLLPTNILDLFPNEFVETELGWVPKGWHVSNIDEACSHIIDHRGKTPKKLGGEWSEEGFPAISAKNIKRNQIVRPDTIRFVDEALYQKWMKEPLQPKDIIMTSEAPMGEMFFLAEKADYLLSQRLYGMRADEEKTTGEYLNYWLQTVAARADLEGRATGTTVTGIRQVELKKVAVLLPDLAISKKFSEFAGQYLLQKEYNNNQITSLEETRDYLLPNLISGKVQLGKVS